MRCKVCGRDFPSLYHFKTADVCLGCYEGMNDEERIRAAQPSKMLQMTTTISRRDLVFTNAGFSLKL